MTKQDNFEARLTDRYTYVVEDGTPAVYDRQTDIIFPCTNKTLAAWEFDNFMCGSTFVMYINLSTRMLDINHLYVRENVIHEIL